MLSRFSLYFDEVARCGSIRQASDRLRIASSAVNRQIMQMEAQLGVKLFERTSQGLNLTAAGEIVLKFVRRWRHEAAALKAGIDDLVELRQGEVSMAVVEGSLEFLGRRLYKFSERYPGINYNILVAGSPGVVDLLLKGKADIGLAFPGSSSAIRVECSLLGRFGVLALPSHPVAGLREISVSECNHYPLVIPGESLALRSLIDDLWRKDTGAEPRAVTVGNTVGTIKQLVLAGIGVAILSENDVRLEIDAGLLVFVPLTGSLIPPSNISAISVAGRALSPAASRLLQHLAEGMREEISQTLPLGPENAAVAR
jgi:DNA-binding transcriptional LysR family regulator